MIKSFKNMISTILILITFLVSHSLIIFKCPANAVNSTTSAEPESDNAKRGTPPYDYIIGKDKLPHFRVFFWVPLDAVNYKPYADKGINTNVSHHGPVENWNIVETDTKTEDKKLVFIFVPKTFVFLTGGNFYKVIHLDYEYN
jgi:hypothetical protein